MISIEEQAGAITQYSRVIILAVLLFTAAMAVGATEVEQSSSLSQFETDSTEAEKLDYVESNFTGDEDTTTVQVIVRDDNVLSRSSLLDQIGFQQSLREDRQINDTLADDQASVGIANAVATTAIRQEQARNLSVRAQRLQAERRELNRTGKRLSDSLNRTRRLQAKYDRLNRSYQQGKIDEETYRQRSAELDSELETVRTEATANLSANQSATYDELFAQTRSLQSDLAKLNASYAAGEIDRQTYRQRAAEIQDGFNRTYAGIQNVLAPDARRLAQRGEALREDRDRLQEKTNNGTMPPLDDQRSQLESMNESEIEDTVAVVLAEGGDGQAFAFMPQEGYEPGSTEAESTMIVITQTTESVTAQNSASEEIESSQLAIQSLAESELDGEALVFGQGIISDEITRSQQDSLTLVSPIALLFVLLVLTIAYRDLLDILLGVIGIGTVLIWTFGFMGWLDIAFNQIFVAVPVLLIGLSIDYAIHVFMRQREERTKHTDESPREAMRIALSGVGVALLLVTATTVIGFLSNLTSPVGPIQEFGVVSAVGIVSALVVFGAFAPALKVEFDELLESFGFDRHKRAFGTGGGAFSRVLELGEIAARRAPVAVILLTLLLSAGGVYGATQVETTFEQKDFIAESPPAWMDDLPEELQPGEYTGRATLEFVNDNFLRQDSTVEFLYEPSGERVASAEALDRVDRTEREVSKRDVTVKLSNDEARITSPLTLMHDVAATNETFNQTLAASDTDGDGVPDRNVDGVYDALFAAAPDRAQQVIYRENGEYRALRLTVAVEGGATGATITDQMDAVESDVSGNGVTVTATGTPIVNKIVQDDLLQTVVESLLITLVVSFLFLMIVYRFEEGSATLGLVTLLPVAFNVSWILGTMYLLDIPFNVLTGMITSLTIGLGVAYSIHISERYSLELDRQGSMWPAMETAVTGTGGALLGSAATTVGGFGVLVFAILPPLQQFGLITGITIVYAFFASVFILPSMLAVWTRYLGPDDVIEPEDDGTDAADASRDESREPTAGGDSVAPTRETPAAETPAVATANGYGGIMRNVDGGHVQPGESVRAEVVIPAVTDRVVLHERTPGAVVEIDDVGPEPVEYTSTDGDLLVAWELPERTTAGVAYTIRVPEDVDGDTLSFDGTVALRDKTLAVGGQELLTVATVLDRIERGEGVSVSDLATGVDEFAHGRLTATEFERVCRAWVADDGGAAGREVSDDD